jgi:hypothetical protein
VSIYFGKYPDTPRVDTFNIQQTTNYKPWDYNNDGVMDGPTAGWKNDNGNPVICNLDVCWVRAASTGAYLNAVKLKDDTSWQNPPLNLNTGGTTIARPWDYNNDGIVDGPTASWENGSGELVVCNKNVCWRRNLTSSAYIDVTNVSVHSSWQNPPQNLANGGTTTAKPWDYNNDGVMDGPTTAWTNGAGDKVICNLNICWVRDELMGVYLSVVRLQDQPSWQNPPQNLSTGGTTIATPWDYDNNGVMDGPTAAWENGDGELVVCNRNVCWLRNRQTFQYIDVLRIDVHPSWQNPPQPPQPTPTPTNTPIPATATPTRTPTPTNTPVPPTATPTRTPTPTNTPVPPTATPTRTPTPTNTPVPPTNTPVPTSTFTPTPTPTLVIVATSTPVPTATDTPVPNSAVSCENLSSPIQDSNGVIPVSDVNDDITLEIEGLDLDGTIQKIEICYTHEGRPDSYYQNPDNIVCDSITTTQNTTTYTQKALYYISNIEAKTQSEVDTETGIRVWTRIYNVNPSVASSSGDNFIFASQIDEGDNTAGSIIVISGALISLILLGTILFVAFREKIPHGKNTYKLVVVLGILGIVSIVAVNIYIVGKRTGIENRDLDGLDVVPILESGESYCTTNPGLPNYSTSQGTLVDSSCDGINDGGWTTCQNTCVINSPLGCNLVGKAVSPTVTPTLTPTGTFTPVPTGTFTPTPTNTPVPTSTFTPTPTNTPVPTSTFTPTPTNTPVPTSTFTPIPTNTPVPTSTPVANSIVSCEDLSGQSNTDTSLDGVITVQQKDENITLNVTGLDANGTLQKIEICYTHNERSTSYYQDQNNLICETFNISNNTFSYTQPASIFMDNVEVQTGEPIDTNAGVLFWTRIYDVPPIIIASSSNDNVLLASETVQGGSYAYLIFATTAVVLLFGTTTVIILRKRLPISNNVYKTIVVLGILGTGILIVLAISNKQIAERNTSVSNKTQEQENVIQILDANESYCTSNPSLQSIEGNQIKGRIVDLNCDGNWTTCPSTCDINDVNGCLTALDLSAIQAPTPTNTPIPPTATPTRTPTPTNTPIPTATNTPVPTPTPTNTPVPTSTYTPTPTPTLIIVATSTPIPTATNTPVPTPTNTPVPGTTATPTPIPTATPIPPVRTVTLNSVRFSDLLEQYYTVNFTTNNFLNNGVDQNGYYTRFTTLTGEQKYDYTNVETLNSIEFTGLLASLYQGESHICGIVVNNNSGQELTGSGNCIELVAGDEYRVEITNVVSYSGEYTVDFSTSGYVNDEGIRHTHFFYNNGDVPETGLETDTSSHIEYFSVSPLATAKSGNSENKTHLCATVVENASENIYEGSGNCYLLPTIDECRITFSDVADTHSLKPYIENVWCATIIDGYPDNTFRPDEIVTREQMSKFMARGARFPIYTETYSQFPDIDPVNGGDLHKYVMTLNSRKTNTVDEEGIVTGYKSPPNTGYFRPQWPVVRDQVTKFVVNTLAYLGEDVSVGLGQEMRFCDITQPHFWDYILHISQRKTPAGEEIMDGFPYNADYISPDPEATCGIGDATFRPKEGLTRGQISKIVWNSMLGVVEHDLNGRNDPDYVLASEEEEVETEVEDEEIPANIQPVQDEVRISFNMYMIVVGGVATVIVTFLIYKANKKVKSKK